VHAHDVPRVEHRLVTAKAARMVTDQPAVLAQLNPIGIRPDFHRPSDRMRRHRVAVYCATIWMRERGDQDENE
jgi:hypothetical protein